MTPFFGALIFENPWFYKYLVAKAGVFPVGRIVSYFYNFYRGLASYGWPVT